MLRQFHILGVGTALDKSAHGTLPTKGGIFDAGVREILRSPFLTTQICTLIHETRRHRSQPCFQQTSDMPFYMPARKRITRRQDMRKLLTLRQALSAGSAKHWLWRCGWQISRDRRRPNKGAKEIRGLGIMRDG